VTITVKNPISGNGANYSMLNKILKVVEKIEDVYVIYMFRGDIKDDSGKFLVVEIEDKGDPESSSCDFDYEAEKYFGGEYLELFTEPFEYENVTDDPDACDGCKRYCERAEDDCKNVIDRYILVNAEGYIVEDNRKDGYKITYGPAPDLSVFALDHAACSQKLDAPKSDPCSPAPPPTPDPSTPKSSPSSASRIDSGMITVLLAGVALLLACVSL